MKESISATLSFLALLATPGWSQTPAPSVTGVYGPDTLPVDGGGPSGSGGALVSVDIVTPEGCILLYVEWFEIDPVFNELLDDPGSPSIDPVTGQVLSYGPVINNNAGTPEC